MSASLCMSNGREQLTKLSVDDSSGQKTGLNLESCVQLAGKKKEVVAYTPIILCLHGYQILSTYTG